jgi:hypothetical protein
MIRGISEKNRTTEEKDEIPEKPLEHLRRLSRESRVKDIVSAEQNVTNVSRRDGSSADEDVRSRGGSVVARSSRSGQDPLRGERSFRRRNER